jgi:hypothetical protein
MAHHTGNIFTFNGVFDVRMDSGAFTEFVAHQAAHIPNAMFTL